MTKYEINKLTDILDIPEDRLDAFLLELKDWAIMLKASIELLKVCAEATGETLPKQEAGMVWQDDGKREVGIKFITKEEVEWIKKYRKKPVVIEAIQYVDDGRSSNLGDIKSFVGDTFIAYLVVACDDISYGIKTLEGDHAISNFDYIIKGIAGEFYPVKPHIFKETYELCT